MAQSPGTSSTILAEENRKYFSENAEKAFEPQWTKDMHRDTAKWLLGHLDWTGLSKDTAFSAKLLDYACGNGMISQTYLPYISKARGLDIAEGMVEQYNARARAEGLSEEKMHAVVCDLLVKSPEEAGLSPTNESWRDFDLVVVGFAMHHVTDPLELAKKILQRLKPGGTLLVAEVHSSFFEALVDAHSQHHHGHHHGHQHESEQANQYGHLHPSTNERERDGPGSAKHTIAKHGYTEAELVELLEAAGFESVRAELSSHVTPLPKDVNPSGSLLSIFAKGVRPLV